MVDNNKNNSQITKIILTVVIALVLACGSFTAGFFTYKFTRGKEISSYEWLLNTIDSHYYEDFDFREAGELSLKEIASLLDPYSEYYTAEEYKALQADNAGSKSGIGVSYNFIENEGAYIVTVMGNSPAYKAGITAGDLITGGEYAGEKVSFSTSATFTQFLDARATNEEFTLFAQDSEFTLAKQSYTASYTCMYTNKTEWGFTSDGGGNLQIFNQLNSERSYLPDGTAYIRLSQFYGTAAAEFGKLIEKFNAENCTSLILDLRNDGGGYVSVMQDIAGYFVSSVKDGKQIAMTAEYKNGKKEVFNCKTYSGASLVPAGTDVYVLANSGTASASEALIGVLVSYGILDYKNIFISDFSEEYLNWLDVPEADKKTARTYGKGIMQSTFVNDSTGEALKLTTAKIFWPNGKCIHGTGLSKEDGCRLAPAEWTATANDEELRYAVENYL